MFDYTDFSNKFNKVNLQKCNDCRTFPYLKCYIDNIYDNIIYIYILYIIYILNEYIYIYIYIYIYHLIFKNIMMLIFI